MLVGETTRGVYAGRHAAFVRSLERILAAIDNDGFIQQMFVDPQSKAYVPDRILELMRQILSDDREKMIERSLSRIHMLEMCFGAEQLRRFEAIGEKLEDNEPNARNELKIALEASLSDVCHGTGVIPNKELVGVRLGEVKEELDTLKIAVRSYEQQVRTSMMQVKRGAFGAMKQLHTFHKSRQRQMHTKLSAIVKEQNQSIDQLMQQNESLQKELINAPALTAEKGQGELWKQLQELKTSIQPTMDLLGATNTKDMHMRVEALVNDRRDDLIERVKDEENFMKDVFERLGTQVRFPMSSIAKRDALTLVSTVKAKSEAVDSDVEDVMKHAEKAGYVGNSLSDAVLFIIDDTRMKESEKMHAEMKKILTAGSRERALLEQRNVSLQKKIQELRETVSQLQEKSVSKEERTQVKLEMERSKLRSAQTEIEHLKRIQQELFSVIGGEVKDVELLRSRLTTKEMELLEHADKVRRLGNKKV